MTTESTTARPLAVKSAQRTLLVLETLSSGGHQWTLSELQRVLKIPKSSLHGLLQTLVSLGWVEVDERGTAYGIGLRALRVGTAYLDRDPLVQAASPLLSQLRNELDETIHLARLDGSDVVYLASHESTHHLRSVSRIGRRMPAHATALGKVLLAMRSPQVVRDLLPATLTALTPETVTDIADLLTELQEVRDKGWSFERGQNTPGLGCFAVAIPGQHPAIDALSCSVPLARLGQHDANRIIAGLTHCADELGHVARSWAGPPTTQQMSS